MSKSVVAFARDATRTARELTIIVVGMAAGSLAILGVFLWYFGYLVGNTESPFVFAEVTATIGALLLVGWVVRQGNKQTARPMATMGKHFIVASLGFLALGMFSPSLKTAHPSEVTRWVVMSLNLLSLVLASSSRIGRVVVGDATVEA